MTAIPAAGERQPVAAVEAVLRERLGSLSLEQKIRLLTGADFWSLRPEPTIGLRRMVLSDGPAGVRGELWDERDPSANIPSPTALAASWDEARVERLGLEGNIPACAVACAELSAECDRLLGTLRLQRVH